MKTETLAVLFCLPCAHHKQQPPDVSPCTKEYCPHCGQLMWMSEKKKEIYASATRSQKHVLLCCYDCFEKIAKEKKSSGEWDVSTITRINI